MIRTAFAIALVASAVFAAAGKTPLPTNTATAPTSAIAHCGQADTACEDRVISRGHADLDARLRGPDLFDRVATA